MDIDDELVRELESMFYNYSLRHEDAMALVIERFGKKDQRQNLPKVIAHLEHLSRDIKESEIVCEMFAGYSGRAAEEYETYRDMRIVIIRAIDLLNKL